MKRVFNSHSEVAHIWAQRIQGEGRANNVFFRGDTIYSYGTHFPIASFTGDDVCLFNSDSYSVSTSKHQGIVSGAIPSRYRVYSVPNVVDLTDSKHKANLESYRERIEESLGKASRARQWKEMHLNDAFRLLESAKGYCEEFGLEMFDTSWIPSQGEVEETLKEWRIKEADRKKREKERLLAELEEKRIEWLAGGLNSYALNRYPETLLRVKGENVETSKGAVFPVDEARKAYRFVKAIRSKGETWRRNGSTFKLGYYDLDMIDGRGNVKAGCHFVRWNEVERIGEEIA